MEAHNDVSAVGQEAIDAMDEWEEEVTGNLGKDAEDAEAHDVVDVDIDGETHTGVVEVVEDWGVKVNLQRNAVAQKVDTGDVWAYDDTAKVTLDNISNVRSVKTSDLHPMDFTVDTHTERL